MADVPLAAPRTIAVVGGGLAGLTAAYYLSRALPDARITLIEASDRTGGWIKSIPVHTEHGETVFEAGPRSVRPKALEGWLMLDLVYICFVL
jgi:oxygen-dependent protoporphyrinogen oxidase